jgi:hypothetical protein
MEKMLIYKKLKLDKFNNVLLKKLLMYLEKTLTAYSNYQTMQTGIENKEEDFNAYLRRIIIKSILVIINIVYSKKYLKDVIAGYSKPHISNPDQQEEPSQTNIFAGQNLEKSSYSCEIEN